MTQILHRKWADYLGAMRIVAIIAIIAMALLIFASHIHGYFFVFDDFFLIAGAQEHEFWAIFDSALIGFYRPLVFALLKIQFIFFGWQHPAGYMAISMMLHLTNALLVGILVKKSLGCAQNDSCTVEPVLASLIFLLSPWAGEGFFWMSTQFDTFSAAGMLSSLIFSLMAIESQQENRKRLFYMVLAILFAMVGLLSKEVSVVLPGLFLLMAFLDGKHKPNLEADAAEIIKNKYFWTMLLLLASCTLLYLNTRANYIAVLSGYHGKNYLTLIQEINLFNLLHPIMMPPIDLSGGALYWAGHRLFILAIIIISITALIYKPKESLIIMLAFFITLAPTAWGKIELLSTSSTRLLYASSIFLSIYLCLGICGLRTIFNKLAADNALLAPITILPTLLFFVYMLLSVNYQQQMWAVATSLSRQTMQSVSAHIDEGTHFYLPDLPFTLVQGPYMTPIYVFAHYFDGHQIKVRADINIFSYQDGGLVYFLKGPDPASQYKEERADEIVINFDFIHEMLIEKD